MKLSDDPNAQPGVCLSWQEKMKDFPEIQGDPKQLEEIWKDIDTLGYVYIWHCLVSF